MTDTSKFDFQTVLFNEDDGFAARVKIVRINEEQIDIYCGGQEAILCLTVGGPGQVSAHLQDAREELVIRSFVTNGHSWAESSGSADATG